MKERELILKPENPFSPVEQEVINHLLEGKWAEKEIAANMFISHNTVRRYIRSIYNVIEANCGVRPHNFPGAIFLMQDCVDLHQHEHPIFKISELPNRRSVIEMKFDGIKWVLVDNLTTVEAGKIAYCLHGSGITARTDVPFKIAESIAKRELVVLNNNTNDITKKVGFYIKAENLEQYLDGNKLKSYFKDGYFN